MAQIPSIEGSTLMCTRVLMCTHLFLSCITYTLLVLTIGEHICISGESAAHGTVGF
jgi:hypothetical protein